MDRTAGSCSPLNRCSYLTLTFHIPPLRLFLMKCYKRTGAYIPGIDRFKKRTNKITVRKMKLVNDVIQFAGNPKMEKTCE